MLPFRAQTSGSYSELYCPPLHAFLRLIWRTWAISDILYGRHGDDILYGCHLCSHGDHHNHGDHNLYNLHGDRRHDDAPSFHVCHDLCSCFPCGSYGNTRPSCAHSDAPLFRSHVYPCGRSLHIFYGDRDDHDVHDGRHGGGCHTSCGRHDRICRVHICHGHVSCRS